MRELKAQKTQTQNMMEVTLSELKKLMELNPWISLGQFDIDPDISKAEQNKVINPDAEETVIGYIAGDIDVLRIHDKDSKPKVTEAYDCWFINKDFFSKNYKEVYYT